MILNILMDGQKNLNKDIEYIGVKQLVSQVKSDEDKVDLDRIELKKLTDQFDPDDVWNGDETACNYQLFPDQTLADKNEKVEGLKLSKKRVTVCFFCNATSTMYEMPILKQLDTFGKVQIHLKTF